MSMFGSSSVTINVDDSGGTPRDVTQYVQTIGGVKVESAQQLTHAFGDSWDESTPTGHRKVNDVPIRGFYDDTATSGPHVVFRTTDSSPTAATRTLAVGFGGTNGTATVEVRVISYEVLGKRGELTEYEAVVRPTGALAWS